MKGIDKFSYGELLKELGIPVQIDEDGDYLILQPADADFGHDVIIYVTVNNNRLSYHAGSPEWKCEGNLLELANDFNCRHVTPMAVVRDNGICLEAHFLLDEEVSEEYVKSNCILFPLSSIWHAFMALDRLKSE